MSHEFEDPECGEPVTGDRDDIPRVDATPEQMLEFNLVKNADEAGIRPGSGHAPEPDFTYWRHVDTA